MGNDVLEQVQEVLRKVFNRPDLVVSRDTVAADVKGWDSLKHVEVIVSIESALGVRFRPIEVGKLRNVGDIVDKIEAKR